MKPNIFHVEAGGEFRPVEITFANETEVRRVRGWRKLPGATDAGEFATLAAKRWFYYSREGASVASLAELRAAIRRNDRAELAFLLVASAAWAKPDQFLALAFCRRTWCHHLVLDFLAVRPGLKFAGQPISGMGSGVLFSLAVWQRPLEWKRFGARQRPVPLRFTRRCCKSVRCRICSSSGAR